VAFSYSNEYIPAGDRRIIWKQLVAIVATLERNGLSHMDLKPPNIVRFGKKSTAENKSI
jgi:serine/threonine protein kinase